MIAIVKVKVIHRGYMKSDTYAQNGSVVWVYNTIDEISSKYSGVSRVVGKAEMDLKGYKLMRSGKEADQYAIDMSFDGNKDINYLAIEKEIRPLFRERILTNLLEN